MKRTKSFEKQKVLNEQQKIAATLYRNTSRKFISKQVDTLV